MRRSIAKTRSLSRLREAASIAPNAPAITSCCSPGLSAATRDACSDPACYSVKLDAHVKQTIAAKPKLVQITTAYGKPAEGSAGCTPEQVCRNSAGLNAEQVPAGCAGIQDVQNTRPRPSLPRAPRKAKSAVCAPIPIAPVHHPKKQQRQTDADAATKAAQEKQRREEAIANTTGIRVLAAIAEAVPVRLMKRDLLFVVERLAGLVDERRLEIVAGSTASSGKRTAIPSPSCLSPIFVVRRKACWAACWWNSPSC